MKLGKKLIFSYLGVSILIGSIGIFALLYFFDLHRDFKNTHQQLDNYGLLISSLESELNRSMITLGALVREDRDEKSLFKTELENAGLLRNSFLKQISAISMLSDSLQKANLRWVEDAEQQAMPIRQNLRLYLSLSTEVLELRKSSADEGAELFYTSVEPFFRNQILNMTSRLRTQSERQIQARNQDIHDRIERSYFWITVFALITVLSSVIIGIRIYRSIARPITMLNEAAQQLGSGNLDVRCEAEGDDEIGELAKSFNSMASSLRESMYTGDYLRSILESVREYIIVTDPALRIKSCNGAALSVIGKSENELQGELITNYVPIESLLSTDNDDQYRSSGQNLRTVNNEEIPVQLSYSGLKSSRMGNQGFVFVLTDIRSYLKAEHTISKGQKEIETLLSEVHHRVKNNLAVINGILHLQSLYTEDENAKKVLDESQTRIKSMANIHELLYESDEFSEIGFDQYLPGLAEGLKDHFENPDNLLFKISAQRCKISLNEAVPFGLLTNELILQMLSTLRSDCHKTVNISLERCEDWLEMQISVSTEQEAEAYVLTSDTLGGLLIHTLLDQLSAELITGSESDTDRLSITVRVPGCNHKQENSGQPVLLAS